MIHNYPINPRFDKKVAYFSMEFAVDQALKIYSGGLGFLAGSHLKSAYDLGQHFIGIGMLWKYGYYDQERNEDQTLKIAYTEKVYPFLIDTGIVVSVIVYGKEIFVKAYLLKPETFKTAPLYLLSTDIPENDYLSQTITHHLYDSNEFTRIAQSIVLGIGGGKVIDALQFNPAVYHINEAHALPIAYHLYEQHQSWEIVKTHLVFTTHTPEKAGNEKHAISLLQSASFFPKAIEQEAISLGEIENDVFDYTLAALRMAKRANAVSKLHEQTSVLMWEKYENTCDITHITNAQHLEYWMDEELMQYYYEKNKNLFFRRKKILKQKMIDAVADQTGDLLDPNVLTIVWARRFAGYKRPDLILRDMNRFLDYIERSTDPIQIIWAGKPYPEDYKAIELFNQLTLLSKKHARISVLIDYELALSKTLKQGADVWLNNPRYTREASGTSGMTAAMNGAINLSNSDGWINEFAIAFENIFLMNHATPNENEIIQDDLDAQYLYQTLEKEVIPTYYHHQHQWESMVFTAIRDVIKNFNAERMVEEYYTILYSE